MKRLLIILLALLPLPAWGNGGPFNESYTYKSGSLQLRQVEDVTLEEEELRFRIEGDYVAVYVRYRLHNKGGKKTVPYAFPVDCVGNFVFEDRYLDATVVDFGMSYGGTALTLDTMLERNAYRITYEEGVSFSSFEDLYEYIPEEYRNKDESAFLDKKIVPVDRLWHMGKLQMQAGHTDNLVVQYKLRASSRDWSTSKDFFASYSARRLAYDLSPAGFWGDGTVGKLDISVDWGEDGVTNARCEFPALFETENGYAGQYADLNLKGKTLTLSYENVAYQRQKQFEQTYLGAEAIEWVKASSTLQGGDYDPMNLFDGDLTTAWVEGADGLGEGEYVEFKIKKGYNLQMIGIVNGYAKSEALYRANARPTVIKLEEREYNAKHGPRHIVYEQLGGWQEPSQPLSRAVTYSHENALWFHDEVLRIYIVKAEKGSKYEDTCITEITLQGFKSD